MPGPSDVTNNFNVLTTTLRSRLLHDGPSDLNFDNRLIDALVSHNSSDWYTHAGTPPDINLARRKDRST